jgi:hypothetical protein
MMTAEEYRAALEWIVGDDTGRSSTTIWAVMMGVPCAHPSIPRDNSDFGRCYRLLEKVPSWKTRLPEVVATYPAWKLTVETWASAETRYLQSVVH